MNEKWVPLPDKVYVVILEAVGANSILGVWPFLPSKEDVTKRFNRLYPWFEGDRSGLHFQIEEVALI